MRRTRIAALRAAVVLAVGFVTLRVVYRVVFGGGSGGGVLLAELPRIRLSGPFEHITLLGPVTSGGIANAVVGALPFAALVLALGLISVVVDLQRVFTRGAVRGPLRTVSRILVVAWAAFPALLDAVRRVRVARRLRGEGGPASLIVPVLERSVERAVALGASMEVRGFAADGQCEPDCERPVSLRGASFGHDGRWSIRDVDLDLAPGTLTLVSGATGSGKSTLLGGLSGLLQHVAGGEQRGVVEIAGADRLSLPPRETARFVGVVLQSVRSSFVAATVADEIGFALATRGVASVIVADRVAEVAARLGVADLLGRTVRELSAGQACLVAIAAATIQRPVVLLLDEPLADLDRAARARVIAALDDLAHRAGVCVVVAEHALGGWGGVADLRLHIVDGRLVPAADTTDEAVPAAGGASPVPRSSVDRGTAPVLEVAGVTVRHGDRLAVDGVGFAIAGGVVALTGPNGAGKSSLLRAIALPERGTVRVAGEDVAQQSARRRRRSIALVPEESDDLLFAMSVLEECRRADRTARSSGTAERFLGLIGAPSSERAGLLARHPRDLSAGERLCLVLAIQLAARPRVLLVDEPSRGLDPVARELVGSALTAIASQGSVVLVATHDARFASEVARGALAMREGRLVVPAGIAP